MKNIYQISKFFISYVILALLFLSVMLVLLSPLTAFMITGKWYFLLGFLITWDLANMLMKICDVVHDKMKDKN